MHVSQNTFKSCEFDTLGKHEVDKPDAEIPQKLNLFLDSISVGEKQRPTSQALKNAHIKSARDFRKNIEDWANSNIKYIRESKAEDLPVTSPSLSREEKIENARINQEHDARYYTTLNSFFHTLVSHRDMFERMSIEPNILTVRADGTLNKHPDPELASLSKDVVEMLNNRIKEIGNELRVSPTYKTFEASERAKIKDELTNNHQANASTSLTGDTRTTNRGWSAGKIIGLSVLGVSGLGLIALAVYLYEARHHAKQRVQVPLGTQSTVQSLEYGGAPNPLSPPNMPPPSLSALGFTPATPTAATPDMSSYSATSPVPSTMGSYSV